MLVRTAVSLWILAFAVPTAHAFHDGGVGSCQSCHIMHESEDGLLPGTGPAGQYLLVAASASEVCLGCHADSEGAVFGADPLAPPPERGAGNFVFLLEDNLNDAPTGAVNPIGGHTAGHNLVAPGFGLAADPERPTAPGGSYASADLGCTSCHDPHGNGNFRMLYGQTQQTATGFVFTTPAPQAEGIELNGSPEATDNHTAYNAGWSAWCGNCHGAYHEVSGNGDFEHPVSDPLGPAQAGDYNAYSGTANPTAGNMATAYLPQTALEDPSATTTSTVGAGGGTGLNCMSCHRAHASSAPSSLRWDGAVVHLVDDGQQSGSYALPNPYPGPDQRSLCEKCHWSRIQMGHGAINSRPCLDCHAKGPGPGSPPLDQPDLGTTSWGSPR